MVLSYTDHFLSARIPTLPLWHSSETILPEGMYDFSEPALLTCALIFKKPSSSIYLSLLGCIFIHTPEPEFLVDNHELVPGSRTLLPCTWELLTQRPSVEVWLQTPSCDFTNHHGDVSVPAAEKLPTTPVQCSRFFACDWSPPCCLAVRNVPLACGYEPMWLTWTV